MQRRFRSKRTEHSSFSMKKVVMWLKHIQNSRAEAKKILVLVEEEPVAADVCVMWGV